MKASQSRPRPSSTCATAARARRWLRFCWTPLFAVLVAAAAGCASPELDPGTAEPVPIAGGDGVAAPSFEDLGSFTPALYALRDAVGAGEDELARRILGGLLARGPREEALELALAFERILDGRERLARLELSLEERPLEDQPYAYELFFVARQRGEVPLKLRLAPPVLERVAVGVSPQGVETRRLVSRVVDELAEFTVPAEGAFELSLGAEQAPIYGALGARDRWTLKTRSGELIEAGIGYPAVAPAVSPAQGSWIAPFLPIAPAEPAELVRYVQSPRVATPPLMERAVRIDPARREEALNLLAGVLEDLTDQRVLEILPAIRWLARVEVSGAEINFWRRWFRLGLFDEPFPSGSPAPDLDLPALRG